MKDLELWIELAHKVRHLCTNKKEFDALIEAQEYRLFWIIEANSS